MRMGMYIGNSGIWVEKMGTGISCCHRKGWEWEWEWLHGNGNSKSHFRTSLVVGSLLGIVLKLQK